MPRTSTTRPYRWLAQFYDSLFGDVRGPMDAAREHLLRSVLPQVKLACDLACGTGTTALIFARAGIKTYAVDLSPHMCRLTREKAARERLSVRVIRADMRSFCLPEPMDLITCEFDALNHVPNKSDLQLVANSAAAALRPGGHFFFDVNNAAGFKRAWASTACFEKPGLMLIMRNGHNPRVDRAWSDIDWFVRDGDSWRRHRERVEEVCWTPGEIKHAFAKFGFDQIRAWDAAPFFKKNPFVTPGCRTFYLARKSRS